MTAFAKCMTRSAVLFGLCASLIKPALASDSVELTVTTTIRAAACTPTLAGGGSIDYGPIGASTLSTTSYTVLPEKQLAFSIVCDAPATVAVVAVNGRPGTLAGSNDGPGGYGTLPAGVQLFSTNNIRAGGLGLSPSDARIGGYAAIIRPGTVVADNVSVSSIRTQGGSATTWISNPTGELFTAAYATRMKNSWAAAGTTTPIPFRTLSGTLVVQAYLNKTSELDLSQPIELKGMSTLELVYL
ncbi:DUF1120 domain-containing protein [Burkholderia pyrrocinia]|uniref:DUF1120 domain-containing protein n=1 Tax=Burkholderia pyrrocinia TaxID=60550 RepID=UPI001047F0CE|nr:DUF1120 domain-containing protein [Burkholderia pyrrocinia]TDA48290.1 DUF1120 domain-containing protein [Burkholderia pyrrocinia]